MQLRKKACFIFMMITLSLTNACNKINDTDKKTPEPYTGKTTLYQLPESTVNKLQMMSYVIQTKDDEIIVIDGGNEGDTQYFLFFLKEKTKEDKPHVDHWFLTHAHSDHTDVFSKLIEDDL